MEVFIQCATELLSIVFNVLLSVAYISSVALRPNIDIHTWQSEVVESVTYDPLASLTPASVHKFCSVTAGHFRDLLT